MGLAWAEAQRAEVQALPNIPTPEFAAPLPPPERGVWAAPSGGPSASLEALGPAEASMLPEQGPTKALLLDFYTKMGAAGNEWDPDDPMDQFELLAKAALRIELGTIGGYLAGWRRWEDWWG